MTRDSTSDNDPTVSGPSIDERESDQNPELVLRDMPLALVTGGARANSIGAAITPRLSADGWDVATSDLTDGEYPCDLAMTDGPQALVDAVNRDRGPIGALVLSHAHDELSGILDTTAASFDRHVAVNARASLLLIAAFARQISPDGGAVVALTSDATTGNLPYGASKGALDRIVISANAVNPGPIDTGWMDDDVRRSLVPDQPTGRLGLPTDIADVVAFLVSEPGRWISGQLLHVDGGFSARF
jgi:3-oxoacyl-[acyl-carrier protein] reductase